MENKSRKLLNQRPTVKRRRCKNCSYTTIYFADADDSKLLHKTKETCTCSHGRETSKSKTTNECLEEERSADDLRLRLYRCVECGCWNASNGEQRDKRKRARNKYVCWHCGFVAFFKKILTSIFKFAK